MELGAILKLKCDWDADLLISTGLLQGRVSGKIYQKNMRPYEPVWEVLVVFLQPVTVYFVFDPYRLEHYESLEIMIPAIQ